MRELGKSGLIGAGIGAGLDNTSELHVMKFDEAMKHEDWKAKDRSEIPKGTKTISSTWTMKKKANGTYITQPVMIQSFYDEFDWPYDSLSRRRCRTVFEEVISDHKCLLVK